MPLRPHLILSSVRPGFIQNQIPTHPRPQLYMLVLYNVCSLYTTSGSKFTEIEHANWTASPVKITVCTFQMKALLQLKGISGDMSFRYLLYYIWCCSILHSWRTSFPGWMSIQLFITPASQLDVLCFCIWDASFPGGMFFFSFETTDVVLHPEAMEYIIVRTKWAHTLPRVNFVGVY